MEVVTNDGKDTPAPGADARPAARQSPAGAPEAADVALVERLRAGDRAALAELYERHASVMRRYAMSLTRDTDAAEDMANEVFARLLGAVAAGRGPTTAVRAYLVRSVRNLAVDRGRDRARVVPTEDLGGWDAGGPSAEEPVFERENARLMAAAWSVLPENWQKVLWALEVDGESPSALAHRMGLTPNAVSALAKRARDGLAQAYLQAHIGTAVDPVCRPFAERLGAFARGEVRAREDHRIRAHLADCPPCTALHEYLVDVNAALRVLLPDLPEALWPAPRPGAAGPPTAGAAVPRPMPSRARRLRLLGVRFPRWMPCRPRRGGREGRGAS